MRMSENDASFEIRVLVPTKPLCGERRIGLGYLRPYHPMQQVEPFLGRRRCLRNIRSAIEVEASRGNDLLHRMPGMHARQRETADAAIELEARHRGDEIGRTTATIDVRRRHAGRADEIHLWNQGTRRVLL